MFGTGPFILAINAGIPAKTMQEFVAYGKGKKLNYGSGGTGSIGHLSGALFVARAGLDSVHVPFKGGGPAMQSLVGGQIDMYFGNASEIIPHAETGKVRILGVATDKRMQQLPNVPTISELYPNFSLNSWNGFMAPAKTPQAIVDRLAQQVIAAARDPAIVAQLTKLGIEPNGTTPQEFVAQIAREQPQFDAAIKAANIHVESVRDRRQAVTGAADSQPSTSSASVIASVATRMSPCFPDSEAATTSMPALSQCGCLVVPRGKS